MRDAGQSMSQHTAPLHPHTAPMHPDVWPADTGSDWIEPDQLATAATVGSLLGNRYLLESTLGEGGMGVVYKATDVEFKGEYFAIKVLRPAIQQRPAALRLLREEVRKTRSLKHPNIVGVYSMNSDPSGAYMLMEYLEGKSLSVLIREQFGRGMPLMRAWPWIDDIASALAYAHDHNVIHSDLKPSNLFVTVWGKAVLLDFGVARAVYAKSDGIAPEPFDASTPGYASSEMMAGRAPDQRDDVYGFACVIYEMLSGKHPFNGLSAVEARRSGLHPAPLASLTQRQNQALAQALAFERSQRTPSVEAVMAGLKGQGRPQWRSHIWLGLGATACIVAGTAVGVAWRGRAPEIARSAPVLSTPKIPAAAIAASVPASPGQIPAKPSEGATAAADPAYPKAAALANTPAGAKVAAHAEAATEEVRPTTLAALPPNSKPTEAAPLPTAKAPAPPNAPAELTVLTPAVVEASRNVDTTPESEDSPPVGKKLPVIIPLPEAESRLASCPYPEDALRQVDTGTVGLLVYVSSQGYVANSRIDRSSGSPSLDQAALSCVRDLGQVARLAAKRAAGHWGRLKFTWSFGG